jgi:hypothetical protein
MAAARTVQTRYLLTRSKGARGRAFDETQAACLPAATGAFPLEYPPVGGRLSQFANQWQLISSDRWVLDVTSAGFRLEFTSTPLRHSVKRVTALPRDAVKRQALLTEVSELLRKDAIYRVTPSSTGEVLGLLLPDYEEDGGLASYPKPQTAQRLHEAAPVQDADPQGGPAVSHQGLMDNVHRPEGLVPACSYPLRRSAMAEVSGGGRGVRVQFAGVSNVRADNLSRDRAVEDPSEWSLSQRVARTIRTRSLSICWSGMVAYAFPPIALLQRVVQKISRGGMRRPVGGPLLAQAVVV